MLLQLLVQIIAVPCYDILRTTEQLAYLVFCRVNEKRGVLGLEIIVTSNKHPTVIEKRIN